MVLEGLGEVQSPTEEFFDLEEEISPDFTQLEGVARQQLEAKDMFLIESPDEVNFARADVLD